MKTANTWKGESRKVRSKTLAVIDARMKKKVGESDLGRLFTGDAPRFFRGYEYDASPCENQARLYAAALGVTLDEARARIDRQREALRNARQPDGFNLKAAREWALALA